MTPSSTTGSSTTGSSSTGAPSGDRAFVVTGPTSGIGRRTALELARFGTVVLAGRDRGRLDEVRKDVELRGGRAVRVVGALSAPASVGGAAARIVALALPLPGLLNTAGIMPVRPAVNAVGWDLAFATNHLGPFAL